METSPAGYRKNNEMIMIRRPPLEIAQPIKKTVYYFDRIFVTDTTVSGTYSRILGLQKTIPLETIKKIEIQDGRKNYRYVH